MLLLIKTDKQLWNYKCLHSVQSQTHKSCHSIFTERFQSEHDNLYFSTVKSYFMICHIKMRIQTVSASKTWQKWTHNQYVIWQDRHSMLHHIVALWYILTHMLIESQQFISAITSLNHIQLLIIIYLIVAAFLLLIQTVFCSDDSLLNVCLMMKFRVRMSSVSYLLFRIISSFTSFTLKQQDVILVASDFLFICLENILCISNINIQCSSIKCREMRQTNAELNHNICNCVCQRVSD